jgi:hypothetical protein
VDPTLPLEGPERPAVGGRSPRPVREAPRFARALPVIAEVMALHRKKDGETLRHLALRRVHATVAPRLRPMSAEQVALIPQCADTDDVLVLYFPG